MAHVKALVERNVKVTVVTPDFVIKGEEPSEQREPVAIPGVEHVLVKTARTPVYKKNKCMAFTIENFKTLLALIRRVKPDLVHATQEASMQLLATACLITEVPLVISMHTDVAQIAAVDQGFSSLGGLLGRVHASLAVFFVCWGYCNWALAGVTFFPVSKHAISMLRSAGVWPARIAPETWGPMVDRQAFRIDLPAAEIAAARERLSFGIPGAYIMVYVGRITAEKDVQFLVDALGRAPAHVTLALVGAGSMAEELAKLHGREHRLYCTGEFVGREEVARAIRAADCCVSASVMETVGFTAMEALSCGTPMLAARAQGFAEHLSHGVNARLFTPGDPASFDRELAAMIAEPREGPWAPEALRASMEGASVDACTDRCLRAYSAVGVPNTKHLRLTFSVAMFLANWLVQWCMN